MRPIRPQPTVIRTHTMHIVIVRQQARIDQAVDYRFARRLQVRHLPPPILRKPEPNLDPRPGQLRQPSIAAMHRRHLTPPPSPLRLGVIAQPLVRRQVLRLPHRRRHRDPELPYQLTHGSTGPSQCRAPDAPRQSSRRAEPGEPPCGPKLSPRRIPCRIRRRPSAGRPGRSASLGWW